jgi:hypothetical protein
MSTNLIVVFTYLSNIKIQLPVITVTVWLLRCETVPEFSSQTGGLSGYADGAASSFAGVMATDSPQPQAEVWFGLLKTKPEESLSTR